MLNTTQSQHPTRVIERKAMEFVKRYESSKGGRPFSVSLQGCGYDIKSRNRLIEVKGFRNIRYPSIVLMGKLKEQLASKVKKCFIYVVYDIEHEPKLKIIKPSLIWENLEEEKRVPSREALQAYSGRDLLIVQHK
jgi:hypothetical protein